MKIHFSSIIYFVKRFIVNASNKEISMGENVRIDFSTAIYNRLGKIIIGNNIYLRSKEKGYHAGMPFSTTLLVDAKDAMIAIGNNTRINGAYIHSQKEIVIGENCVIASGVNIIDSNGHKLYSSNRTNGRDMPETIRIGNNVWIGLNSIILKGTEIGDNSVVGAGSVVKGSFPKDSLIVGNPAVVVKQLEI